MRWSPSFHYGIGGAQIANLIYPVQVWTHRGTTVGKTRHAAEGLPHVAITRVDRLLRLTLRFTDAEWPTVRQVIAWGQTGASFLWLPGDLSTSQIEASVNVFMVSPRMRDTVRPVRDSQMPWLLTYTIVLRRADDEPWSLQYFREPPVTALAASGIEFDEFVAHWMDFPGALGYEIDVSTTEDFSAGVTTYEAEEGATSQLITGLIAQTLYYYRVRALYRNPPFADTPNSNVIEVQTTESFQATGGTITFDGDYTVHTFNNNGTFEVIRGHRENVEVLIVGGGGPGGGQFEGGTGGGGGGGGRVVHLTTVTLDEEDAPYAVVVGAGGVAQRLGGGGNAGNGGHSSFGTQTAPGGGAGGHGVSGSGGNTAGSNGGSGGGGGSTSWFTGGAAGGLEQDGAPTAGNGQNGGAGGGSGAGSRRGGGGGGATEVGDAGGNNPANGGDGYTDDISGVPTTYGGGGGGCAFNVNAGNGGAGGGGRGGSNPQGAPVAGTDGLGGGGGGAWEAQLPVANGGKGVVIVRYLTELP